MSVAFFFALLLGHAATMAEHPETMLVEFASPFGGNSMIASPHGSARNSWFVPRSRALHC
jgi:hypothetical protein